MGRYTDHLPREVRLEYLRPEQVEQAKHEQPAIYLAFGSIEWHGYHNALGLDALKAHEQLVGLAIREGGVVYPPVYLGSGGGHGSWPSSFMVDKQAMIRIVSDLLSGFERDGYRSVILLSGHYPNRREYLDSAVSAYRDGGGVMRVLAIVENEVPGVGGDHASKYETSSMLYLHPRTVDMDRLAVGSSDEPGGPEERRNWMDPRFREHPCYGLVGIDPRVHASSEVGRENTDRLVDHLARWLREGLTEPTLNGRSD